jgi:hypothetical protein
MIGPRLVVAALCAFSLLSANAVAGQLSYEDFSSTEGLELNGSASVTDGMLRLTPAAGSQAGSAFTEKKKVDTTERVRSRFTFRLHDSSNFEPGDGFVFAFQNDERGAGALGGEGGALGFGDPDGITPAVGIAFNAYGSAGRVYFVKNGSAEPISQTDFPLYDTTLNAWVDYSPASRVLKLYASSGSSKPDLPVLRREFNLKRILGEKVRVGFTAGTGAADMAQDILSWSLTNP